MTLRSVILGFLLGLFVAAFSYFNDQVIRQTFFVGNHLPYSVFGLFVVLVLVVNPLLGRLRPRLVLRPAELAVVVALGLAACLWPGAGLMRCFTAFVTLPASQYPTKATWKSVQAMSYVPGCSSLLAEGFVTDWMGLARALAGADSAAPQPGTAGRIWQRLPVEGRTVVERALAAGALPQQERGQLVEALNRCIGDRELYVPQAFTGLRPTGELAAALAHLCSDSCSERDTERANRLLLEAALPGLIRPAPRGDGLLLANGDPSAPALENLLQGWPGRKPGLLDLPWAAWLPTMAFWLSLALLFGIASFCLVLIVQPQWKREMLPYPLARFVQETAEPASSGWLPQVAHSKLFWYGLGAMLVLHTVNGLFKWYPNSIQIVTSWEFNQFWSVLPASFVGAARPFIVAPTLFPTVIAFTFFLSTQVSFSVGISVLVYAVLAMGAAAWGVSLSGDRYGPGNVSMLRVGAYIACTVMVVYVGRRYYLGVAARSLGLRRGSGDTPAMAVWALRVLLACVVGIVVVLARGNLDWQLGLLLTGALLVMMLVLTRINAETGIFFSKPDFIPIVPFLALLGVESLGPVTFFVMLLVSMVLAADLRENAMTFLANGVYVVTGRRQALPQSRTVAPIAVMVVVSLAVAFAVTLLLQYQRGLNYSDGFAVGEPSAMMDLFTAKLSSLSAYDDLNRSMGLSGWDRFLHLRPMGTMVAWLAAGFALYAACSLARMRFAWWPLHPVLFLVLGTWFPSQCLSFSIFVGWLCKVLVTRFGGAKGYHTVKPLMFGIIAGELLAALGWSVAGVIYFHVTGLVPKPYAVFYSNG